MKRIISFVLAMMIALSSAAFSSFNAFAGAEQMPLDGTPVNGQGSDENFYHQYGFSLENAGYLDVEFTVSEPQYLDILGESGDYLNSVFTFGSDEFEGVKSVTKSARVYLAAGKYSFAVYSNSCTFTIKSTFTKTDVDTRHYEADSPAVLSVSKPFESMLRFDDYNYHKIVVKKDFRLSFDISHTCPVRVMINDSAFFGEKKLADKSFTGESSKSEFLTDNIELNLKKGTYYLFVQADASENGVYGGLYSIKTTALKFLSAPSKMGVKTRKNTSLTVNYPAVKGAHGYQVQCSDGGTKWAQTKTGKSLTCCFKGLEAGGAYKFRVRTYVIENGVKHFSSWSKIAQTCTKPGTTKVKSLRISSVFSNAIVTNFSNAGRKTMGYQLQYSTDAKFKKVVRNYTIGISDGTLATYSVALGDFTRVGYTYYVRVRAVSHAGNKNYFGEWSNAKKITMP